MGNGVNIANSAANISAVDMCGQKVLGMSGSLMSYINTGNAGEIKVADSFLKANNSEIKKEKKNVDVSKIIKGAIVVLGAVALGCVAFQKKGKIAEFFSQTWDKTKKSFSKAKNKKPTAKAPQKGNEIKLDIPAQKKEPKKNIGKKKNRAKKPKAERFYAEINAPNNRVKKPDNKFREFIKSKLLTKKQKTTADSNVLYLEKVLRIYPLRQIQEQTAPVDYIKSRAIQKAKLDKIIAEVKSVENVSDDNIDFEHTLDVCKKAMLKPVGEALSVLEEQPKVENIESLSNEAKKIAKKLQEEYHRTIERADYRLPDSAFDELNYQYIWEKGDKFRIYDPTLGSNIGYRYKMDENLTAQPLIQKKPNK